MLAQLTLKRFDKDWADTVDRSWLARPLFALKRIAPSATLAATVLQWLSYFAAIDLICALGAPQFANDKEGLAIIALIGFVLWFAGYLVSGKDAPKPSAIDALVLLYFGANVIAACASHYLHESIVGLAKVAVYIISYFYLTRMLNHSTERKVGLIAALAAVALAVSLFGFYQYIHHVEPLATWEDPTLDTHETRIFSTLNNPNLLAGFLVPLVPLFAAVGVGLTSMGRWLFGLPFLGVAGVVAVATILTGSRGGWIGLFVSLGFLMLVFVVAFWREKPKLRVPIVILIVGGCLSVLLALHYMPSFQQRVSSIFAGSEHSSNAFRMNVWRASFRMFKDNWWFGVGPGKDAFVHAYGLYMESSFDALGTYCVPLEVGVECGILGLAAFVCLIASLLARGHAAFWMHASDPESSSKGLAALNRWIALGAGISLVGMMVHGMVDTVFYRPQVQFIFWLLVAFLTTTPLPNGKAETSS